MDEKLNVALNKLESTGCAPENRDENKSPTSGSSSETFAEEMSGTDLLRRKQSRNPRTKRKRKWKPYNELTWDEKKVQDDRESRRAYAKRERLSAEGHPIAPYNTTQFLMDDRTIVQSGKMITRSPTAAASSRRKIVAGRIFGVKDETTGLKDETTGLTDSSPQLAEETDSRNNKDLKTRIIVGSDSSKSLVELDESNVNETKVAGGKHCTVQAYLQRAADSPLTTEGPNGEDIQRFILDDFSHTYADIHAEQLQNMSKGDLVEECLKLEKRVDALERRVKDCRRKHKYDLRGRTDMHLLDKINQLQVLNSQLQKDNAALVSQETREQSVSTMPVSDNGAQSQDN